MTDSELSLIQRIAASSTVRPGTIIGIGDDAAVFAGADPTVVSHDLLVHDVHFRLPTPERDLGHKALAVNLSDIAAMGARPVAALVGLILPPDLEFDVDEFYEGLEALAERTGVTIAGGDISRGRELGIAVCAIGSLPGGAAPLTRSGALPGDRILVTGPLGGSEAGRALIEDAGLEDPVDRATRDALIARHLRPEPAFEAAAALRDGGAHAVMDCSDGLLLDAQRMAEASGCAASIDLDRVPLTSGVAAVAAALNVSGDLFAATGGEDYCLIAAVPESAVSTLARTLGEAVVVGAFAEGCGIRARRNGEPVNVSRLGYTHDV